MTEPSARVLDLPATDAPRVVAVLRDAFRGYPVMRFVLGDGGLDPEGRLERLVGLFVGARALRGEPLMGIAEGGELVAAATLSDPARSVTPPGFAELREQVWAELGSDARARYEACVGAWGSLPAEPSRLHVNMIGVRPGHRGRGLARILLGRAHRMSAEAGVAGVDLTTEDARNVLFYQHLGYRVTGHAHIGPDLETWGLFRPNPTV